MNVHDRQFVHDEASSDIMKSRLFATIAISTYDRGRRSIAMDRYSPSPVTHCRPQAGL
jgi:hypothetical protein